MQTSQRPDPSPARRMRPPALLWAACIGAALLAGAAMAASAPVANPIGPAATSSCDPNRQTCVTPTCTLAQQALGVCTPGDPGGGVGGGGGGGGDDGGVTPMCRIGGGGNPGCGAGGPSVVAGGMGGGVQLSGGNPINLVTGDKYQEETDLEPLPGVLGLEFKRAYNSASSHAGLTGAGWRMSYETVLYDFGLQLQIVQADGRRLMFQRGTGGNATLCSTPQPRDGQVRIIKDAQGVVTYVWRWPDGRTLSFAGGSGGGHPLQAITAPGGERLTLTYSPAGDLVQVRDPQGRKLAFVYGGARHLLQAIDTPLGRIDYAIDERGRLTQVAHRADANTEPYRTRIYHYEDRYSAGHPYALTGISLRSLDPATHRPTERRLSTYVYNRDGMAVLTTKGQPRRVKDGVQIAGTGIEQVEVDYVTKALPTEGRADRNGEVQPHQLGKTIITNSLGKKSEMLSAVVGGNFRLVQMTGPGCSTCGPTNVRYIYNAAGQVLRTVKLDDAGRPVTARVSEYDIHGRVLREGEQADASAKSPTVKWTHRYEYADVLYPDGSVALASQPALMARPSVVPGKEHVVRYEYNEIGQPARIMEEGFSPIDQNGQPVAEGAHIVRVTSYRYAKLGARTLLVQIDGPLPNGPRADPSDSDITRFEYDELGNFATAIIHPMNLREAFTHDALTGRLEEERSPDGIVTHYHYDADNELASTDRAGHVIERTYDDEGRIRTVSDGPGRGITLGYDAADHLVAVVDAQGYKAETSLDTEGDASVTGLYEPGQAKPMRATYRWFDEHRREVRQLLPDGRLDTWKYDARGQLIQHVDGDEVLHLDRRSLTTDAHAAIDMTPDGLIQARIEGHASVSAPRRDDFGRVVAAWLPGQGARLWSYSASGQVMTDTRLDRHAVPASVVTNTYDAADRLLRRVTADANGRPAEVFQRRYDGARLVEEGNEQESRRFTYDAAGQVAGTTIALLDAQGRPAFTTVLRSEHDAAGEVRQRTLADGSTMQIVRRQDSRVAERISVQTPFWSGIGDWMSRTLPTSWSIAMRDWLPRQVVATDIGFDPYDGVTGYTQGNGIQTRKQFDTAGRMKALKVSDGMLPLAEATFRYATGLRIQEMDVGSIHSLHGYDGFGKLEVPAIEHAMQVFDVAQATPHFDLQGRLSADGKYRYAYTATGQVESVSNLDGAVAASYRYNAHGQRVSKTVAGNPTIRYLWEDDLLVGEVDGSGEVAAQYLYLGDQGRFTPIAKIEGAHAAGNATGAARMLFIHADYRGEPVVMSDAAKRVVWRAAPDDRGYVPTSAQNQEAVLNLRLPGQYFDQETGLHDNWHRSYDARPGSPLQGRYISPDPLGYPDGPDPYAYVGGDPVNRIDPTGLYEEDVHYYMTYFLAIVAGLSPQDAQTIASADRYIDDNPNTEPFGTLGTNFSARADYHFTQDGYDTSTDAATRYLDPHNPQIDYLHSNATDSAAPSPDTALSACARTQFYGEFLHAYEDTYAHRDQNNVPYGYAGGHLTGGHNPDYTYNHVDSLGRNWQYNEDRTEAMEAGVFSMFHADFSSVAHDKDGKAIDFSTIQATVEEFNANTLPEKLMLPKLDILKNELDTLGLPPLPTYNCNAARDYRNANLVDVLGNPIKQSDYPGTVLATPAVSAPCKKE